MHTLVGLRRLELQRNRLHVLPSVLTHFTCLSALLLTANEVLYTPIAPRIAALPHLRQFTFPTPFESFSWNACEVRAMLPPFQTTPPPE